MSLFLTAIGVPSDANTLERCGHRAWPSIGHFQCTLLTGKCEARQNADVAILLLTPWVSYSLLLITQILEKQRVNGNG